MYLCLSLYISFFLLVHNTLNSAHHFTIAGHFWAVASSVKCGTWCSFGLACVPNFAKQNHYRGYWKLINYCFITFLIPDLFLNFYGFYGMLTVP
jgi:hypothetical protein